MRHLNLRVVVSIAGLFLATALAPAGAQCGNGVIDANEDCDDGGTCIGGSNAGAQCFAESDCQGNGVCIGGAKGETACDPTNAGACPGGTCEKCVPQGGDGCAANCTTETQVAMSLQPGELVNGWLKPGTSGSIVWTDGPLGAIMLPFQAGATETLAVGKQRNGQIPVVVPAAYVHFPEIPGGLLCACVREIADETCGGYLLEATGNCSVTASQACSQDDCPSGETCVHTPAIDCTPGYIPGTCSGTSPQSCTAYTDCPKVTLPDKSTVQNCIGGKCANCRLDSDCSGGGTCVMHACDGRNSCAFVNGAGNSGSGIISCVDGMQGVNLFFSQDSYGWAGKNPAIVLYGTGVAGSAVILHTTAIGLAWGTCSAQGATYCTDADPFSARGTPSTLPSVTGLAEGEVFNANQTYGDTICNCPTGLTGCDSSDCIVDTAHPHGGHSMPGAALPSDSNVCSPVPAGSLSGLALLSHF